MRLLPAYLSLDEQQRLLAEVHGVLEKAPLYTPVMPRSGNPLSVRMSNCGPLGWLSEVAGYRYARAHPVSGAPWPEIPDAVLGLWRRTTGVAYPPEACLIN